MATQVEKPSIDGELLDRLLAGRDPKTVLESEGLIGDLKRDYASLIGPTILRRDWPGREYYGCGDTDS
ncbi:MAG: hypothetical protein KGJ55_00595 [Gammaproteobacteria bacterium]|nr:hypothetical protein [Gammaproteobacteria bacterium]